MSATLPTKPKRYAYEYYEDAPHSSGHEEDPSGQWMEAEEVIKYLGELQLYILRVIADLNRVWQEEYNALAGVIKIDGEDVAMLKVSCKVPISFKIVGTTQGVSAIGEKKP